MQTNKYKGKGRVFIAVSLLFLGACPARALLINTGLVANVTQSQFDLFIQTSEPADSWVEVFADAAGTQNLEGTLGVEKNPLHTGDPLITTNYYRRAELRIIQSELDAKSLALFRVSGATPETTYYVRVQATNSTGTAQWPESGLMAVTTEKQNSFLMESRQLILNLDPSVAPPDPRGAVGVLSVSGADYPIVAVVGDGCASNQLYFDLSGLFSATEHSNLSLSGTPSFEVTFYAQPSQPLLSADFVVSYSNLTQVACASYGDLIRSYIILEIRSAYAQTDPPVGFYTNSWGTEITCTLTNAQLVNATTQQVFTGWTLANGLTASNGSSSSVTFSITNSLVLTWNWKTQYWLDTGAGEHGSVDTPDQWVDAGDVITIAAQPDVYYHIDSWSGDTQGTTATGNDLEISMTQARSLVAFFAENITSNGVPESWFVEQGLGAENWETLGSLDQDHDGMLTWKEYIAGTSPTNGQDALKLDIEIEREDHSSLLVWKSVSNRVYKVWRSTNLAEGFQQVSGSLQATPPVNTFADPQVSSGQPVFYRISVEKQ